MLASFADGCDELNRELQAQIARLTGDIRLRSDAASWATATLKAIPDGAFSTSNHWLLCEYVLSRLIDDDWTSDAELMAEMHDLIGRLQRALLGDPEIP